MPRVSEVSAPVHHTTPTCTLQGCAATIVMPTSTPAIKVAAVRALGGIVDLHGESYQEAQAHAQVRSC